MRKNEHKYIDKTAKLQAEIKFYDRYIKKCEKRIKELTKQKEKWEKEDW